MRKKLYLFIIAIICTTTIYAQTVTTNPEYPIAVQSVTVTLDATGSALEGYTGNVYAHTGVLVEGNSSWQHVIGSWGNNSTQPKLTRISTDKYELEITPNINDYYGVSTSETVTDLCFVFRNEDGDKQTPDIIVPVYSEESLNIVSPDSTYIFSVGEDVEIEAVAHFANNMILYVNGTEVENTASSSLSYTYTATQAGWNNLKVKASDGTIELEAESRFFVREANTVAELPSPDLQDGINYIDDNTVTLVLYAPFKDFVFVKGSFNDWALSAENQMSKTPDGKRYWITINDLMPGKEYLYQYVIDSEIVIADPYTEKTSDPDDKYIDNATYPDLIDYPKDKITGQASIFQTAQTEYEWKVQNFTSPAKEDLVIYELLIRDFIAAHNYKTLIDTLDYIENLGINAIELMPVNEFEGNSSWGYNPSFYFALDKYYGTKNDLKAFIDSCHTRGIAVIADMVLNHSFGQSPLVQMYFDPFAGEWGEPTSENPWYNQSSPNPVFSWGFDFNHESADTKDFIDRVNRYWLEEYKFDGFRFDFTKGFTNSPGEGNGYDASRIAILKRMADEIWNVKSDAYIILEHFAANNEEKELATYGMMIWGNINYSFSQASMGYNENWNFDWASYKKRGWEVPNLVAYMESHDEERVMFRNLTYGNSEASYNIKDEEIALDRMKLASLFLFAIPGPKMIWQFGELGYDISIDDPCRVCEKPILWEYYEEPARLDLYNFMSQIIALKKTYNVFKTDDYTVNTSSAVKEIALHGDTLNVHVLGNFGVESETKSLSFANQNKWYEYFSGAEITPSVSVTLEPGEYRLYTDKKMPNFEYAAPPVVENVNFSGTLTVGNTLHGVYSYSDPNNDPEGKSVIQWYSAANKAGAGTELIENATGKDFVITGALKDKFIAFGVKPVAKSEKVPVGKEVRSAFQGPVTGVDGLELYPNPCFGNKLNVVGMTGFNHLDIYNLYGKKMFDCKLNGQYSQTIIVNEMQAGMYLLKFSGKEGTKLMKIIVTARK